ncbi:YcaO-like family protein [Streptomyces sp. NPDC007920]|uniref:YcaO-like family protein n=1 Tax=Streptomyces sp. NPDC007920 TaxID=3364794 RepID=UPI0036EC96BB
MTSFSPIRIGEGEPVDSFLWVRGDEPPFIAMAGGQTAPWAPATQRASGAGVHPDRDQAARAAICEVLERQSAFRLPRDAVLYGAGRELVRTAAPHVDIDLETPGWWVLSTPVGGGDPLAFPLEYVQFAPPVRNPLTDVRTDSTGMAVHLTHNRAVAGGLAELTERTLRRQLLAERVTVRWDVDTVTDDTAVYTRQLRRHGCRITLVPARSGDWWVCAALVSGTDPKGEERLVAGSAASHTPHAAADRALAEAYAKAYIAGLASRPGDVPDSVSCTSVTLREAAGWLAEWGVNTASVVAVGGSQASLPTLCADVPEDVFLVDRGDTYTDDVGLVCTHVFSPEHRSGMPESLAVHDLGWRLFG